MTCEIGEFQREPRARLRGRLRYPPSDAKPKFESYQFVEKLEPFSESATFSLARAMDALGMDADAIAAIKTMTRRSFAGGGSSSDAGGLANSQSSRRRRRR